MAEIRPIRVLLVPAPFEGHLPSMMNLGSSLHAKGFSVTVVRTDYNHKDISKEFPRFDFFTIPDGMTGSSLRLLDFVLELNTVCEPLFREFLDDHDDVDFIIYDEFVYFPRPVAEARNLPKMVFSASSAATSISRCVLMDLQKKGRLPPQEATSQLEEIVKEFKPFRFKDLPVTAYGSMERLMLLYGNVSNRGTSRGIIHNSSNCLESSFISAAEDKWGVPIYPIGPLHKTDSAGSCPSLFEEERSCLEWLEKQENNSVIYISMGSLAKMEEREAVEMALGLVQSGQPFLWVIRPGSIAGDRSSDSLPEEFRQAVNQGRGLVVEWAPQKEVLGHRVVGGFWSHCGWNSCLESISCGVPVICRPYSGDQRVNTRLMTHNWRTASEFEGELERGTVASAVRMLIVDKEGDEMRARAITLMEEVAVSVGVGGSSSMALDSLVHSINPSISSPNRNIN